MISKTLKKQIRGAIPSTKLKFFTKEYVGDYMVRWILIKSNWFSIYVHQFLRNDDVRALHDHPKWIVSIGLKGQYIEEQLDGSFTHYKAPFIRLFSPRHTHRIRVTRFNLPWTLVITGPYVQNWGFYDTEKGFIPHEKYLQQRGK